MNEIIERATNSITEILESSKLITDFTKSQLVDTRKLLNQLLESDLSRNDWTRLFCRQLNRLMVYNTSLSADFWSELHDDILYIFEGPNGKQHVGNNWERFLKKMKSECELERRMLQFHQTFGDRKSLHQVCCQHQKFFKEYLQKCVFFHSKVQVRGLVENLDDLLYKNYGLPQVLINTENRERLKQKLKSIEIPFDCLNRSVKRYIFSNPTYEKLNNNPSNFFPSVESRPSFITYRSETILSVLESNRWLVILGDPGSAKTTLLRWITLIFAEAALRNAAEGLLKGDDRSVFRIPILIRIGEFADWIKQHKTKTLIDYIGEHTWFSEPYCPDDNGSVLRELIYHGHALILLDGLDEIPEVGRKGEIVDLVQKFIDEYVRTPDFISAFDDAIFDMRKLPDFSRSIIETQLPSKSDGNQVVITSRVVGYRLNSLNGAFIEHYSLLLMDHKEAKQFVNQCISQTENGVLDLLMNEGIKVASEIVENLSQRRLKAVENMFESDSKLLMSNPSLLSLICTSIFQSPDEFHPKSRIEVYEHAVESVLRYWTQQTSNISKKMLTDFLMDFAAYLHLESPSGLIDEFDLEHLCRLSLRQNSFPNDRTKLDKYAKELISSIDSNVGIVAERGLQVFGFLHLSFQEYFVAQYLIRDSIDEVVNRFLAFIINPRFRESLLLALGWISRKWSFEDYDTFCNLLVTPTKDYPIPLGTLLFFDALNDIQRLPSNSIIYTALNALIDHPSTIITGTYFIINLTKLHKNIIIEWMQLNLRDDTRLFKFCQCLPMKFDEYDDVIKTDLKSTLFVVYQQLCSFHNISAAGSLLLIKLYEN